MDKKENHKEDLSDESYLLGDPEESQSGMYLSVLADDPGEARAAIFLNSLVDDPEKLVEETFKKKGQPTK